MIHFIIQFFDYFLILDFRISKLYSFCRHYARNRGGMLTHKQIRHNSSWTDAFGMLQHIKCTHCRLIIHHCTPCIPLFCWQCIYLLPWLLSSLYFTEVYGWIFMHIARSLARPPPCIKRKGQPSTACCLKVTKFSDKLNLAILYLMKLAHTKFSNSINLSIYLFIIITEQTA